jgi:predicted transcriptional regulator
LNDSEMTSEHVRAARMLLRWEQKNLAKRSGVSLPTIKRLEAKPGPLGAYASTLAAIRAAFEDEGIEFFNDEAPGVRLHRRPRRVRPSRRT